MSWLFRKKIKGISIHHPLAHLTNLNKLPDDEKDSLTERLKSGDTEAAEPIIRGHIKLAINIASQYANVDRTKADDLVSTAMHALVEGCIRVADGALTDNGITGYLMGRVHYHCSNFIRNDRMLGPHFDTMARRLRAGKPAGDVIRQTISDEIAKPRLKSDQSLNMTEIEDILNKAILTRRERRIIELKQEGFNVREIAARLAISKTVVSSDLCAVKRRFEELEKDG